MNLFKYMSKIHFLFLFVCNLLIYRNLQLLPATRSTVECRLSGQVGTEVNPDNEKYG